jgi:hypothetical protein
MFVAGGADEEEAVVVDEELPRDPLELAVPEEEPPVADESGQAPPAEDPALDPLEPVPEAEESLARVSAAVESVMKLLDDNRPTASAMAFMHSGSSLQAAKASLTS